MHEAKPFPAPRLSLTVREALRATGIGRSTLYKLIAAGRVRRVKIGTRVLIPFDDLQKLVAPEDCAMSQFCKPRTETRHEGDAA
jgi:excisionase family DNA binding protein